MNRRGFFGSVAAFFSFLFGGKLQAAKLPETTFKHIVVIYVPKLEGDRTTPIFGPMKQQFEYMDGNLDAMGGLSEESSWREFICEYNTSVSKEDFLKRVGLAFNHTQLFPPVDGV